MAEDVSDVAVRLVQAGVRLTALMRLDEPDGVLNGSVMSMLSALTDTGTLSEPEILALGWRDDQLVLLGLAERLPDTDAADGMPGRLAITPKGGLTYTDLQHRRASRLREALRRSGETEIGVLTAAIGILEDLTACEAG